EVLERVKHLFSIPNIKFIIATDTEQLCHSISAVYGNSFDSRAYLRRFFDQSYTLPKPNYEAFSKALFKGEGAGGNDTLSGSQELDFAKFSEAFDLKLRDMQQCYIRYRAVIYGVDFLRPHHWLTMYLIMLKMKDESIYCELRAVLKGPNTEKLIEFVSDITVDFNFGLLDKEFCIRDVLEFYLGVAGTSDKVPVRFENLFENLKYLKEYPGVDIFKEHIKAVELAANLN
ncbi:MAG: hypothetical protein HRT88_15110, partial [Lentisphaeraceae bacterium]|nr:hypothetical protein [Lentisphaeraceae bacterium]